MTSHWHLRVWAAVAVLGLSSVARAQPVDGQLDTFDGGTADGWSQGTQNNVTWISDGGPLGNGDGYIEVVADGDGKGGRLTVRNADARWIGDWLAEGITDIDVDLVNDGAAAVEVRLKIEAGSAEVYTAAITVPADGQWASYSFGVLPTELTGAGGATMVSGVTGLRIEHNPNGTHPPPPMEGALGIDNVEAFGVEGTCGDGVLDRGEVCDGAALGAQVCSDQGFDDGVLACAADCLDLDISGCVIFDDGGDDGGCRTATGPTSGLALLLGLLGLMWLRRRPR